MTLQFSSVVTMHARDSAAALDAFVDEQRCPGGRRRRRRGGCRWEGVMTVPETRGAGYGMMGRVMRARFSLPEGRASTVRLCHSLLTGARTCNANDRRAALPRRRRRGVCCLGGMGVPQRRRWRTNERTRGAC